ncbi:hypothetical protein FKM82_013602 [Ascaphus truei]
MQTAMNTTVHSRLNRALRWTLHLTLNIMGMKDTNTHPRNSPSHLANVGHKIFLFESRKTLEKSILWSIAAAYDSFLHLMQYIFKTRDIL